MTTDAETREPAKAGESTNTEAPLTRLGKYQIERKLGQGGMGAVYLARDTELRRMVAIKVLPRDKASNPILVRRFKAEAQAAAQLRHDNIVAVYDSDEADGYLFIAMEFVDGKDLHEMISRRGTIPVKRSIEIIKQVAAALQHAHEHKIVHRDIKPSNLLIRKDGAVKLTDLGLARSVDDTIETGITRAGTTVGTVDYMAPEQARNSKLADIRSDLYSLGCTWFQMLTGHAPYPEGSLTNKLQAHAIKPIPDPRTENPNVTEGLVAVIQRMMAKKPEDRYESPKDLIKDLESSALTRAAFSQEILNAIDDDSGSALEGGAAPQEQGGDPGKSGRNQSQKPRPPGRERVEEAAGEPAKAVAAPEKSRKSPSSLPPPLRRRPVEEEVERPPSPWGERFKMILLLGGVVAAVGGMAWLVSGFGNAFGPSGVVVSPKVGPDGVVPVPEEGATAVAAVAGGPSGAQVDTTTPVAAVFNTPMPGGNSGTVGTSSPPGMSSATGAGGGATNADTERAITATNVAVIRPADPEAKPVWPTAPPTAGGKTAGFSVGGGASSSTHFNSLNDALQKLPPEGGVIKLQGNGPFPLLLTTPIKVRQLIILGDPRAESMVVPVLNADGGLGRFHVLGDLELSHLHIAADQSLANSEPTSLVTVENGSATLLDSTISVVPGSGPAKAESASNNLTAVTMIGARAPQRLNCRRCAFRGELAAGISIQSAAVDVVLDECLVATGAGPVTRWAGPSGVTAPDVTSRWLRVFASTLCSRDQLLDFTAESGLSEPARSDLIFRDVLACTSAGPGRRILLNVTNWLQQSVRDQISWTSRDSTFVGFRPLLDLGSKSSFRADDAESWRQFWRQKVEDYEFVNEAWPAEIANFGVVTPAVFDRNQLPTAARHIGARGELPGVDSSWLQLADDIPAARLSALASRPAPRPAVSWKKPAGELARIDIRKQDLGQVIGRNEWPDGALIEAVGFGVCTTSPVQVRGKRLKIVFRQAEGGPLRIMPKEASQPDGALFEVEQGTLELEGLRAQYPELRPKHPSWLISGRDSAIILKNCELRSPEQVSAPYQGLIQLIGTVEQQPISAALQINTSVLFGAGPLLRTEGAGQIFLRESALAAQGNAIESELKAHGSHIPLSIDLTACSVSATLAVFDIVPASMEGPAQQPARLYVDDCAFVSPGPWKSSAAIPPSLVTAHGSALPQRQVAWWGRNNGVIKSLPMLLSQPESAPEQPPITTAEGWSNFWGTGHDLNLLVGDDGVVLAGNFANRIDQLRADQFRLHPSSKSAGWADGRPLGANLNGLESIGPKITTAKPEPTNASPKPVPGNKGSPKPNRVNF